MAVVGQYTRLPVASITATNPSVGSNGATAPTSSTEVAGINPSGNLNPLHTDASNQLLVNVGTAVLPTGSATAANQATQITAEQAIQASVASVDTKTPALGQALAAGSTPVVLTAAQVTALTPPSTVTVIQPTGTNLHAVLDSGSTTTVTQATASNLNATVTGTVAATQSGTWTVQPGNTPNTTAWLVTGAKTGTALANAPVQNIYSTTNITTGAYVQLVASTSNIINTIYIFDSSGQAMILAIGASGSEVNQIYVPPGGGEFLLQIPSGTRIAYKALSANATTGYLILSFLK